MSYMVLTSKERQELVELFFRMRKRGEQSPNAREEAVTALRCLKAINSNAIEDRGLDRVFLQLLLHNAGVPDKSSISAHYNRAATETKGQEELLRWLEMQARNREEFSISMLLEMHGRVFSGTLPNCAGKFRNDNVEISGMAHQPPHHSKVQGLLHQRFEGINQRLFSIGAITPETFFQVLQSSAEVHYLVAHVHPFEDGNGRIARAAGDYAMLAHGFYYDVIMSDYRDLYLDALEECTLADPVPLRQFLEFSYLETLQRISGFFEIAD